MKAKLFLQKIYGTSVVTHSGFGFVTDLAEEVLAVEKMQNFNEGQWKNAGDVEAIALSVVGMCALQASGLFFFCHYFQLFI